MSADLSPSLSPSVSLSADLSPSLSPSAENIPQDDYSTISYIAEMVGERIKSWRGDLGINQRSLAELSGVSLETIQAYEIGAANPTIEDIKAIAEALQGKESSVYDSAETDYWEDIANANQDAVYDDIYVGRLTGTAKNMRLIMAEIYEDKYYFDKREDNRD